MNSPRIILTGASGTLGYNLALQMASKPDLKVLALLRNGSHIWNEILGIESRVIDFFDTELLASTIQQFQPDCFIHCAAAGVQFPRPEWFDMVRFNVDVTLRLCEAVSHTQPCRFVYVSTGLAYKDQGRLLKEDDALETMHPYGASKAAADILVRSAASEFGVPLTVVRPFSFTGVADIGSRLFPALLRAAEQGTPLDLSPGEQIRDHCAVQDIGTGIMAAADLDNRLSGKISVFNLGSGKTLSLRALVEQVVDDLGLKVKLNFGARPYIPYEPMFLAADIALARRHLNWQPESSLSYAVWQLAKATFPQLQVKEPPKSFEK